MKRISILGLGYIGLPTAILTAEAGYDVFGFDISREKIKNVNAGNPMILEPEIKDRLVNALKKKSLKVSSNLEYADCFIIAVPTPLKKNNSPELRYVFRAAEMIAERLMPGNLIIIESTIPVRTTEKVAEYLEEISGLKQRSGFFIAHCPERGLPGVIFKELIENDRVIGGICQRSCELARQFYAKFVKGYLHITDDKTAEMVKLVENSSRDVQIAFANQVASMCHAVGINPYDVIDIANKHPRVKILSPTCGVGGHCIAIDPHFLIDSFPNDSKILQVARSINEQKPYQVIEKVLSKIEDVQRGGIKKPKILGLGVTFKPNVDDLRESPALKIALDLAANNDACDFVAYDSYASPSELRKYPLVTVNEVHKAILQADIILILVKHKEFLLIPEILFCNKIVIDTCGLIHDLVKKKTKEAMSGISRSSCSFESITF